MRIICSTVFMAPEIGPKHHGALLFVQHSRSIKVEAFTDHFHLSEKHRWNFQVLRQSWGHPCHLGVHDVSYWTALGPSWPFAFKSQLPRRRSKQGSWNFSIPFTHFSVSNIPLTWKNNNNKTQIPNCTWCGAIALRPSSVFAPAYLRKNLWIAWFLISNLDCKFESLRITEKRHVTNTTPIFLFQFGTQSQSAIAYIKSQNKRTSGNVQYSAPGS